jgi:hypothetical protein
MIIARAAGCFSPRFSTVSRMGLRSEHKSNVTRRGERLLAMDDGGSLRLLFCGAEGRSRGLGGIAPAAFHGKKICRAQGTAGGIGWVKKKTDRALQGDGSGWRLKTTDKRCSQGEMPWEMTEKKIWVPLLGLAAKGDEKAERGFGFHGEEGGEGRGAGWWRGESSAPCRCGAVAGGVHGCWLSRGATPWKTASSLLLWSPCCRNFWAPWEEEVDELLLAVEQGEQRARPGSKRRELAGRGCAPCCSRGRGGEDAMEGSSQSRCSAGKKTGRGVVAAGKKMEGGNVKFPSEHPYL